MIFFQIVPSLRFFANVLIFSDTSSCNQIVLKHESDYAHRNCKLPVQLILQNDSISAKKDIICWSSNKSDILLSLEGKTPSDGLNKNVKEC